MTSIDFMFRKNMRLSGQGSMEWVLIVSIIGVAIIAGLTGVQGELTTILDEIVGALQQKGQP